jgi:hypothetical protein
MTATPRTDAVDAVADQNYGVDLYRNMLEHSRQLERELTEARADAESYRATANRFAERVAAAEMLFENEKATSTHLEELNVALVRQAILTVLDESNPRTPGLAWNFDDDEQRVDFADQVVSWLAVRATPSAIEPRSGPYTHPNDDPPGVDFEGRKYERRS